jgi:hypothetical protein
MVKTNVFIIKIINALALPNSESAKNDYEKIRINTSEIMIIQHSNDKSVQSNNRAHWKKV